MAAEASPSSPRSAASAMSTPATVVPRYSSTSEAIVFELTSSTATSSALTEPLGFSTSRSLSFVITYSSSALYILRAAQLPQVAGRAFRIPRKPTAVAISDPGHVLAILWDSHKLDLYSLYAGEETVEQSRHIKLVRSINLSWATSTIAFDPANKLLAAGNEEGIEIIPVIATGPIIRRQLACALLSSVAFSDDSKSLLATHHARKGEPTTIITVRTEEEGGYADDQDFDLQRQDVHQAWIQKINFSQPLSKVKQATFGPRLTECDDPLSLFAYDVESSHFGIFDLLTKKFTNHKVRGEEEQSEVGPYRAALYSHIIPAVNVDNTHVSLIRNQKLQHGQVTVPELCVYRFPDTWRQDVFPKTHNQEVLIDPSIRVSLHDTEVEGLDIVTVSRCQWLNSTKLVVLMNSSAQCENSNQDPTQEPVAACGQICILRLVADESVEQGPESARSWPAPIIPWRKIVRLDKYLELESFPDERLEFEQEVALQRSRTVAQRRQQHSRDLQRQGSRGHSASSSRHSHIEISPPNRNSSLYQSPSSLRRRSSDASETIGVDEPYSQMQPRSQFTLQRAATVAAASPANRRHLASLPDAPLEYRRADGRGELPHESDADDPRPPPPPYTRYPDEPGPGAVSLAIPMPMQVETHPPRNTLPVPQLPTIAQEPGPNISPLSSPTAIPNIPMMPASIPSPAQARPAPAPALNSNYQSFHIPRRAPSRLAVPGSLSTSMTFPGGSRTTAPQSAAEYRPNHYQSMNMYNSYPQNNSSVVTLPVMGSSGNYYSAPRSGSRAQDERPSNGRSQSRLSVRDKAWYRCAVM